MIGKKNILSWIKSSNRWKHRVGGFLIALVLSFPAALGSAGAMEFKDWQWGGKPEWADFLLTVAGGLLGGALHLALIVTLLNLIIP